MKNPLPASYSSEATRISGRKCFCGSVADTKEWRWARMKGSRAEMYYGFAMVTVKLLCLEIK